MISLLRKSLIGLPVHRSFSVGGKPYLLRISNSNIKVGVIEDILTITVKQLPRPLGRGLWEKPVIEEFQLFSERT